MQLALCYCLQGRVGQSLRGPPSEAGFPGRVLRAQDQEEVRYFCSTDRLFINHASSKRRFFRECPLVDSGRRIRAYY